MKTVITLVAGVCVGALGAVGAYQLGWMNQSSGSMASGGDDDAPLYWVAPMDPNYRRDAPGKSPMGMDLIPVYAKDQAGGDSPGLISIAPEVVNNLGVKRADVVKGALKPEIRSVGYLQYDQTRIEHIHPRVEGWIEKSYVKSNGDPVKKGEPLYDLYAPALVNAQEELLFALSRGEPRLVRAAEQRLTALNVPSSVIASVKKNRKSVQTVRFYAPFDGVVDNLSIQDGFYIKPGMTLLSIASLDQVWLEGEVFERQAKWIKPGQPVQVTLDYQPGEQRIGLIDYVYPTLDAATRTLKIRVVLENPDRELKPNMFARMKVMVSDDQERILIPNEALIRGGQQDRVVMALGDGRFKSVAVEAGLRDTEHTEILAGLKAGDRVVTSAQFMLDSESSKSSDFERMMTDAEKKAAKPTSVWVESTINSVDLANQKINVDHAAIEAWSWPTMTMDFTLAKGLDASELKQGLVAHLEVTRGKDNQYEITQIHIPEQPGGAPSQASDHSAHQGHEMVEETAKESSEVKESASSQAMSDEPAKPVNKVWAKATVLSVDPEKRSLNAQHEAIPEWSWPAMTMDFTLDEWVEIDEIPLNKPVHLEISKEGQRYLVTDFYAADE
jgi:Cu(I)/Ag(I) efflux system membrane fusion protein